MKKTINFFMRGKNNVSYKDNVINGITAIFFLYITTEITLWFTLSPQVYDKGLLAVMLFGFCNLMLFAGCAFFIWICKNYSHDIEKLLPGVNRYHRLRYSMQDEILMDHILSQLLKGNTSGNDYEEFFKNNSNLEFLQTQYRVVIFVPENEYDSISEAFNICNLSMNHIGQEKIISYTLEIDNKLIFICFPKKDGIFDQDTSWLEMSRFLQYTQVKVEEKLSVHLSAAVSGRHIGLAGLKTAFSEAMEAYEYQRIYQDESSLVFYNNIKYESSDNEIIKDDIWYEIERKLIYNINIGDFEKSQQIIKDVSELIDKAGHASFQMIKYRVFGLINALYINLLERRNMVNELLNINAAYMISNCKSIVELKRTVNIIYKALEREIAPKDNNIQGNERVREIAQYIEDNYNNVDLNGVYIANHFQLTPAYISRIFKKELAMGPAEYLQKTRLEAAKNLLLNTDTTIKDISEIVGYQYVLTMNRAFKKYEGMTPSEYILYHKDKLT